MPFGRAVLPVLCWKSTCRELLKQELQQNEKASEAALQALRERITAYPNRNMEVKFRRYVLFGVNGLYGFAF